MTGHGVFIHWFMGDSMEAKTSMFGLSGFGRLFRVWGVARVSVCLVSRVRVQSGMRLLDMPAGVRIRTPGFLLKGLM